MFARTKEEKLMGQVAYSVKGAGRATATGTTTLYDAINEGQLKAKKLGRRTIILAADLERWLDNLPDFQAARNPRNTVEAANETTQSKQD
jgi:excisionase family DNA binding protein